MTSIRRTAFVLAVSVVALAAGCAGRDSSAPTDTTSPSATPAATVSTPPSPQPSNQPSNQPVVKAGCPVDATTLAGAFNANPDLAHAIILGSGFSDITCYMDYATARANPVDMDRAMVLFAYDRGTGTWKAISGGTDLDCRQAPTTVVAHLPGCHNQ